MSQRADQVLVYSLGGPAEGGLYSVSLAMVQLSAYVPLVLSHVSFPRLASLPDAAAAVLTARIARLGFIGSFGVGILLAATVPFMTPLVFGPGFAGAVTPALILLPGAVLWSLQWVLARAWSARGRSSLVLTSFLLSVVTMLLLDLILIPLWGLVGAALASVAGSTAGFAWCVVAYHRRGEIGLVDLVPRWSDVRSLSDEIASLLRAFRR
jgi:O-antigen/teichoic acid export membrane protein